MILLDTNVISEMMKPSPSTSVMQWMDKYSSAQLFISSITITEIVYGLNALPDGSRKQLLEQAFSNVMLEAFHHRVLSFDQAAAFQYGKIMARRKAQGRPLRVLDGQIAATACVHGFAVATRNVSDFMDCGVELMNPFDEPK